MKKFFITIAVGFVGFVGLIYLIPTIGWMILALVVGMAIMPLIKGRKEAVMSFLHAIAAVAVATTAVWMVACVLVFVAGILQECYPSLVAASVICSIGWWAKKKADSEGKTYVSYISESIRNSLPVKISEKVPTR